jgi:hypothetical protein
VYSARCISAASRKTIGHRSGPRCACNLGARNRFSAGDKKPAENEIRITVVGRDRIMADNDELGGAFATTARPPGSHFPRLFPFSPESGSFPLSPLLRPRFTCLYRVSRFPYKVAPDHRNGGPQRGPSLRFSRAWCSVWVHQPLQE